MRAAHTERTFAEGSQFLTLRDIEAEVNSGADMLKVRKKFQASDCVEQCFPNLAGQASESLGECVHVCVRRFLNIFSRSGMGLGNMYF